MITVIRMVMMRMTLMIIDQVMMLKMMEVFLSTTSGSCMKGPLLPTRTFKVFASAPSRGREDRTLQIFALVALG